MDPRFGGPCVTAAKASDPATATSRRFTSVMKPCTRSDVFSDGPDSERRRDAGRGPPWAGTFEATKAQKNPPRAPLGLLVVEPDYVEGFLPAASRRKRQVQATSGAVEYFPGSAGLN